MASILDLFATHETSISYVDPISKIPVEFTLDVSSSIDTTVSAKVTEFPIEGRDNITDHVQPGPRMLTLTGLISESPSNALLVLAQSLASGVGASLGLSGLSGTFASVAGAAAVSGAAGAFGGENISALLSIRATIDPGYPERAMKGLILMLEAGQRFTVRTYMSDDLYTDMVFTSVSFKNDAQHGISLPFTLTCKQVKTVSAFGKLPIEINMKSPANSSAATAVTKGTKNTSPPTNSGDKGTSVAKDIIKSATGG